MRYSLRPLLLSVLSLALITPLVFAQPNENEVVAAPVPVPLQRLGTPEQQIKDDLTSFIRHLNNASNFWEMQRFIVDSKVGYFGANEWFKHWVKERDTLQLTIGEITVGKIEDGTTTATVSLKLNERYIKDDGKQDTRAKIMSENVNLKLGTLPRNQIQFWQIVPPTQDRIKEIKEPPILQTIAYVLAQQDWVYPETIAPTSLGNLKMLGLSVLQFTQDYDDRYAFAPKYMQEALAPYTKSTQIFQIPNTDGTYTFNGNLSDKPVAHIAIPSKTVLFYEGENEQPIFRYNDKAAIAFADGHAVLVTREEAKDLIWKP